MMRRAREDEMGLILDWAAAEGWNPGLDDAAAFFAADPQGFFIAERDGEPIAAISVVNHSKDFAFLGLYLCLPELRGRGIAYALWQHALEHAGARTVGLDGVAAQQGNYAKSGFVHAGASLRLQGPLAERPDRGIRVAQSADLAAMLTLDRAATGVVRPRFLENWTAPTRTRQTLVLDGASGLAGFATIRRCREGVKIGPITARDAASGLRLACAALAVLPSEHAIIDVPENNLGMIAALEDVGFQRTFATARMFRGPAPRAGSMAQAIATMELG